MAESLELRVERRNRIGILAAKGYINNTGGEKIAAACDQFLSEGIQHFLLDLEECRMVNSIGISILIEIAEKVSDQRGRLAFCCATPTIAKTLRIMGLLQTCTMHSTPDEALAELTA